MNEPINLLLKMLYYFEIECIYLFGFWSTLACAQDFLSWLSSEITPIDSVTIRDI